MEDVFARIILGHLTGDYLLQSRGMALKKSSKGFSGIAWCFFHSLVYVLAINFFLWKFSLILFLLIFLSHYPVDRWSLGKKWLKIIRGRNFVKAFQSTNEYREIDIAFSCIVYTVVDNTIHLLFLWLITKVT